MLEHLAGSLGVDGLTDSIYKDIRDFILLHLSASYHEPSDSESYDPEQYVARAIADFSVSVLASVFSGRSGELNDDTYKKFWEISFANAEASS